VSLSSFSSFEELLRHPAPGFRCYDSRDPKRTPAHIVGVKHHVAAGATDAALGRLRSIPGAGADQFVEFHRRHDGVRLFAKLTSDDAGIVFFPLADWEAMTEELRQGWLSDLESETSFPAASGKWWVFGEAPGSGNAFVWFASGPHAGSIFYFDHDDFGAQGEPMAADLSDFLGQIVRDPAEFLYRLGCFLRFMEPNTYAELIPSEYVPDVRAVAQNAQG